jgi:hypothetical protein
LKVTIDGITISGVVLMAGLKQLYEREFNRTPTREELVRFTKAFIAASPEVRVEK